MRRQGNGRLVVALAMAFLLSAQIAAASSFGLAPLGLSISSRESSGSIVAQNNGDDTIVLQVKTLRWTQREGKDVREETRDLLANPPIFKLGPGNSNWFDSPSVPAHRQSTNLPIARYLRRCRRRLSRRAAPLFVSRWQWMYLFMWSRSRGSTRSQQFDGAPNGLRTVCRYLPRTPATCTTA